MRPSRLLARIINPPWRFEVFADGEQIHIIDRANHLDDDDGDGMMTFSYDNIRTLLVVLQEEMERHNMKELIAWCREGTAFMSSPVAIAEHPSYQRILQTGSAIVPFLLEDLRDNGGDWYIALRKIVTDPPTITPEMARSSQRVREAWLEWGRHRGYQV